MRARFFQQLSDRGTVDEFEVRWNAGGEPMWAVLSARRVRFQGEDAILTAFTPINHLKLMERRGELWAKVFETSSEGILIVDAQHRILTANQAFSHHTGYELQEAVGEKPSLMMATDDSESLPDALWQAVARRGTWQGELQVRLLSVVRAGDTVSRLGGDEFVIVLNGVHDIDEMSHIVYQRLVPLIRQPPVVEGAALHVSCSGGIAICPDDATDIDELMRHADTAMYQAKAAGKDAVQFFTREMIERTQACIRLDADLRSTARS